MPNPYPELNTRPQLFARIAELEAENAALRAELAGPVLGSPAELGQVDLRSDPARVPTIFELGVTAAQIDEHAADEQAAAAVVVEEAAVEAAAVEAAAERVPTLFELGVTAEEIEAHNERKELAAAVVASPDDTEPPPATERPEG